MSPPDRADALVGDALLGAVTDAIVALHLRHFGRAPDGATAHLIDDELLTCTLSGSSTDVETTMSGIQRADRVPEARHPFPDVMETASISIVERLSGRPVRARVSNYHVGPDLTVELFLLGLPAQPVGSGHR